MKTLQQPMEEGKHKHMAGAVTEACDLLRGVAQETRFTILCILAEGETSVRDLQAMLKIRQPTISQHLAALRACHLVTARRQGKAVYYALDSDEARALIDVLYDLYK